MVKNRYREHLPTYHYVALWGLWGQSPMRPLNRLWGQSPTVALGCFLVLVMVTRVPAIMQESGSAPWPASTPNSFQLKDVPFEFLAGPVILKSEAGVGLAARAPLPRGFQLELGGLIPHRVSEYASAQSVSGTGTTTDGHVRSFGELHLGLLYPLYKEKHLSADVGAGFSLGFIKNEFRQTYTAPASTVNGASRHTALSPWLQTSAAYHFTDHWAIRLQVAYVRYGNNANFNQSGLDLDFSGVMVSPMLQWRM